MNGEHNISADRIQSSIDKGLAWLDDCQLDSGEFPSYASQLDPEPVEWAPDTLKFISALVALEVSEVPGDTSTRITTRVGDFLHSEMEPRGLWRYWTKSSDQFMYTPRDADDTACCSMAVHARGGDTGSNVRVLLANRSNDGRFYTWMIPRRHIRGMRLWWILRDEFTRSTRQLRSQLWENSEASPTDIDGVVNANVIRYLGPDHAPEDAIAWIQQLVMDNEESDCDSWHRSVFTLYRSIADGYKRGITQFESLGPVIVERIVGLIDVHDIQLSALEGALALSTLQTFDGPLEERIKLATWLLEAQNVDGSWDRSVFYFGGPMEVFGWGSESLSTATAVSALHGERRRAEE